MNRSLSSRFQFLSSVRQLKGLLSRAEKVRCVHFVVMAVIGAVLDMLLVGIIPTTVALVADPSQLSALPLVGRAFASVESLSQLQLLKYATIGVVFAGSAKLIYFFLMHGYVLASCRAMRIRLTNQLLRCYLAAPWTFHVKSSKAELLRNLVADMKEMVFGVIQPLVVACYAAILTLLFLVVMIATLPSQIILVFGLTAVAVMGTLSVLSNFLQRHGKNAKVKHKVVIRQAQEALAHFVESQLLGGEDWFIRRFSKTVDSYARSQDRMQLVSRSLPYLLELVSLTSVLLIVVLLTRSSGNISSVLPEITLIAVGAVRLRQSTTQFTGAIAQIQFSAPSLDHVAAHLKLLNPAADARLEPFETLPFRERLEVQGISYRYPDAPDPTVRDLSLAVRQGQSVAFIGETGCGKSTLLRILLGLLEPTDGRLLADGQDIHQNLRGWQANIGYVPQHVCLLDASIRENITLGIEPEDVDQAALDMAIDAANLRELVETVPGGLEARVGDNGSKLSGGQQQRIGIARAVYQRPQVFVLDEATSALDQQTEFAVMKALEELPWRATLILVTHRLKAIEAFDQIFELKAGQLASEPAAGLTEGAD